MKRAWNVCLLCLVVAMALLLPLAVASADRITSNGAFVDIYATASEENWLYKMRVGEQEVSPSSGGYYRISGISGEEAYVRRSSVTVLDGAPEPTPTPVITLAPGVTPTPTPVAISGQKDAEYSGTVISYTAGAGGVWLYDKIGGSAAINVPQSTTIKMTSAGSDGSGVQWWSVYYKSKTYYVPQTILDTSFSHTAKQGGMQLYDAIDGNASQIVPQGTSVKLTPAGSGNSEDWWSTVYQGQTHYVPRSGLDSSATADTTAENMTNKQSIRSVHIASDVKLYASIANVQNKQFGNPTENKLLAGTWVNATYLYDWAFSTIVNGVTYYFNPAGVVDNMSSGSVVGSTDTDLMSSIKVADGTKLYTKKDDGGTFFKVQGAQTVYGVKEDTKWYKVQYGSELLYLHVQDIADPANDVTQIAYNDQVNTIGTTTFWVTAGVNGAKAYRSTATNNQGQPSAESVKDFAAGENVLASPYNSYWYAYVMQDANGKQTVFYLFRSQFANENTASSVAGVKVFLPEDTHLYSKTSTSSKTNLVIGGYYYVVLPVGTDWYSITYNNQTYYIPKTIVNEQKWTLELDGDIDVHEGAKDSQTIVHFNGSYVATVYADDAAYYLIKKGGVAYFVEKAHYESKKSPSRQSTAEALSNKTEGSSYYVTIGIGGATYYKDAACTQPMGMLGAGETVNATKYTSALYMVTVGGARYYLPVQNIASIRGGDDAANTNPVNPDGNITDITKGKTDDTFAETVFSYTIPAGGLWLYKDYKNMVVGVTLNQGTVVKLNTFHDGGSLVTDWYTTWYGGVQYFVPRANLKVEEKDASIGTGYSVEITQKTTLYRSMVASSAYDSGLTIGTDGKSLFINARVAAKNQKNAVTWYSYVHSNGQTYYIHNAANDSATGSWHKLDITADVSLYATTSDANPPVGTLTAPQTIYASIATVDQNGVVLWYQYQVPSVGVRYIRKADITTDVNPVNTDSLLAATHASNLDASLITKLEVLKNTPIYMKPDTSSTSVTLRASSEPIYGVRYNAGWYQIIYNDAAWYVEDVASRIKVVEQISVSTGAASTTYTVVVASGGAFLFTKPDLTRETKAVKVDGKDIYRFANRYTGGGTTSNGIDLTFDTTDDVAKLPAGATVTASAASGVWYTITVNAGGTAKVLYFQNTNVSNGSSNSAIRSYTITLQDKSDGSEQTIRLYNVTSETAQPIRTVHLSSRHPSTGAAGMTYTLRQIDKTWSSVVMSGVTYYLKNADIPQSALDNSIPIASTSVGGTYTITIGGKANNVLNYEVFASSTLKGNKLGTLAAGTRISGTKMYVAAAEANTQNGSGLVYAIKYGNVTGYIDACNVSGVYQGDEVAEANKATQDQQGSGSTVLQPGQQKYVTLNAGFVVYKTRSTSSGGITLSSTVTVQVTKVETGWYSYVGDDLYFIPASALETGASSGATVNVNETVTVTVATTVATYEAPDKDRPSAMVLQAGQAYSLKKVSDTWYEVNFNGMMRYVLVTDVVVGSSTPVTPTNVTRDASGGIITAKLLIVPATGRVNLRKLPSTGSGSTILAYMPKDTQVVNNSYTRDANGKIWYNVTFGNTTGYVIEDYVQPIGTVVVDPNPVTNPTADIGKSMSVNVGTVNIRSSASAHASIVGQLEKGGIVTPVDVAMGDDGMYWYKFWYTTSVSAWIRADYLTGSSISANLSGNVAVKAGETNLRSGAGDSFSLIMKLARDVIVTIVGNGTDSAGVLWYRVTLDNHTGYVRCDLLRPLTNTEISNLQSSLLAQYTLLKFGDKGDAVKALQQQLINVGYLAQGSADGVYGTKTTNAVKSFQKDKGYSQTGTATPQTQAALFNTAVVATGNVKSLDWFANGYTLLNQTKAQGMQVYDINSGITWTAKYINGAKHADVIPASAADAQKLKVNNITGSYVRRPVLVTVGGTQYAGSMYAVGHGTTSYCSYFSGVMCIHFTGSKTHGSDTVDSDHQAAIADALNYGNSLYK